MGYGAISGGYICELYFGKELDGPRVDGEVVIMLGEEVKDLWVIAIGVQEGISEDGAEGIVFGIGDGMG